MPTTLRICSIAFCSFSLTRVPPMPRNPPSFEASATCDATFRRSRPYSEASLGLFAETAATASRITSRAEAAFLRQGAFSHPK